MPKLVAELARLNRTQSPSSRSGRLRTSQHWLLDRPEKAPSFEVWRRLGPNQTARLLFIVLRRELPSYAVRDAVAGLLRTADQPVRAMAVIRYLTFRSMIAKDAPHAPTDLDPTTDSLVAALLFVTDRADFVRFLYLMVLGRRADEEEVSAYVARLTDHLTIGEVVAEIIGSVEFRQNWVRQELAEWMFKILAAAATCVGSQHKTSPFLPERVSFGAGEDGSLQFLQGEWHEAEAEGIWSKGRRHGLMFRLPFDGQPGDSLVMALRVAGTELTGPRSCRVAIGERRTFVHILRDDERSLIRVSLDGIPESELTTIQIELDRSHVPADAGGSDPRELGIFLYEMFLERA
jgi:hypothetical protein